MSKKSLTERYMSTLPTLPKLPTLPTVPTLNSTGQRAQWCASELAAMPNSPQKDTSAYALSVEACTNSELPTSHWSGVLARYVLTVASKHVDGMASIDRTLRGVSAAFSIRNSRTVHAAGGTKRRYRRPSHRRVTASTESRERGPNDVCHMLETNGIGMGEVLWNNDYLLAVLCVAFRSIPRVVEGELCTAKEAFRRTWRHIQTPLKVAFRQIFAMMKPLSVDDSPDTAQQKPNMGCVWGGVWPAARDAMRTAFMRVPKLMLLVRQQPTVSFSDAVLYGKCMETAVDGAVKPRTRRRQRKASPLLESVRAMTAEIHI
jgi:hypothetical protein